MKAHGDVDARVHIYIATALGRGRVANPMLGCLYPSLIFYRRLSEPQDQSGHEGVKKNLHTPLTPRIEPVVSVLGPSWNSLK